MKAFHQCLLHYGTITDSKSDAIKDEVGEYSQRYQQPIIQNPFKFILNIAGNTNSMKLCISYPCQIPFGNPKYKRGIPSHPVHIGGINVGLNLQILRLKLKDHLKNTLQ